MNQIRRHHVDIVVWMGLWGACGLAQALGLGQSSSRATLGQSLAFTVPVRLAPGESFDAECVSADVVFGDDPVAAVDVDITVLKTSQGPSALRVVTSTPVHEPVVTVKVSAGCLSSVSRQYVVLADLPGSQAGANRSGALETAGAAQVNSPSQTSTSGRSAPKPRAHPSGVWSAADSRAVSMRWSAPASPEGLRPAPAPIASERLVLSGMRMSSTMDLASGIEDERPEVQAQRASASAHWRALQVTPSQLVLAQARLLDLERRVAELQAWRPASEVSEASDQPDQPDQPLQAPSVASAPPVPAPQALGADPDEVRRIRIVGLTGVALFGLLAWAYQRWQRRGSLREHRDIPAQEPGFSLPPPSWMSGRR
jgi:pilus assembly protein FimV